MANTLRDLQLCELEILKEVKRICEENGIIYYLSSGTLLGAVRHRGFIPWDDDIDVEMPYQDYLRFIRIAQGALGEEYFLQNHETDTSFVSVYSKVRKNHTTMLSDYERGTDGHHGVWIDIFPIISIGGPVDYHFRRLCIRICNFAMFDSSRFEIDPEWIRSQSNALLFCAVRLFIKLPLGFRRLVRTFFEKLVFMGATRKTKRKAHIWGSITYVHPASVFNGSASMLPFEDDIFSAPPDYDEYLRNAFGDYMTPPPEDKRGGGHGNVIIDLEHSWERYNTRDDVGDK